MMTTSKDIRFYDTSSLLIANESLFESGERFAISSITFEELEEIKTSQSKDFDVKFSSRLLLHLLEVYKDYYDVIVHTTKYESWITDHGFRITNDTRILSDAIAYDQYVRTDETVFVTNDLSLKHIANLYFGDGMIESIEDKDDYSGYKEVKVTDEQLEQFYQDQNKNSYNLNIGQYLIIRNEDKVVDLRCWTGQENRYLKYNSFNSKWFGKIEPYDIYQKILFDSLSNNQMTMVKGAPGAGKTLISLGFLMSKLDKHELDRIIVFCNTVATIDSAKLGLIIWVRLK